MYIKEYLDFVAGIYSISKKKINEMISLTGLEREQHKKISQLSKGYKQRVGLAAALIHDPEVLILDEPTTGLDPNQLVEVRNLIKECGKNKTVLLSTHIMQEVERICNRVIIINKGQIVANEKLDQLKSNNVDLESYFQKLTQ
jgi:ABC-2 type transport system ATP-binding protein